MRRLKIAVDIDDVLADNAEKFTAFSNLRFNTRLTTDDYNEDWSKMWQVDINVVRSRAKEFHDSDAMSFYDVKASAIDVLSRFSERHDLLVITSRRVQVRETTHIWLSNHYPGIFHRDNIHFAGIWDEFDGQSINQTKASLVSSLGADVLIDDQPKHCIGAVSVGAKAILFGDYSWNKIASLPENIMRCRSWLDVERSIEQMASPGVRGLVR
ncbi:hypothetical protein EOM60_04090 [Candidatus Saccharibacteria bacterium]|nr:hypothetical protein [Candidatus Saccharibacteria bacterium]